MYDEVRDKTAKELFLIQIVDTRVISLKIVNKKIEIAPIFLMNTPRSLHFSCVHPSVTGHKWTCLVNGGPSNRQCSEHPTRVYPG